jgi:hypothetical protein
LTTFLLVVVARGADGFESGDFGPRPVAFRSHVRWPCDHFVTNCTFLDPDRRRLKDVSPSEKGAPGGIRTPNLLIRRSRSHVRADPSNRSLRLCLPREHRRSLLSCSLDRLVWIPEWLQPASGDCTYSAGRTCLPSHCPLSRYRRPIFTMSSGFRFSMQHPLLMPSSVTAQANSALSKASIWGDPMSIRPHAATSV